VFDRFSASAEQVLWYYRSLVEVYSEGGRDRLVDELDLVVTELERLVRDSS